MWSSMVRCDVVGLSVDLFLMAFCFAKKYISICIITSAYQISQTKTQVGVDVCCRGDGY